MKTLMTGVVGALFGFVMSRIGFTSWLLLAKVSRQPTSAPRGMHPGILGGGALFGIGWALSGGCPTIVLAQIGEGQLAAVCTLGGIIVGNWVYSLVHERYFKWPTTSCLDD